MVSVKREISNNAEKHLDTYKIKALIYIIYIKVRLKIMGKLYTINNKLKGKNVRNRLDKTINLLR